ncbi:MAG: hypothetical protein IJ682_08635 [Lachnospiraceae bacterium]|nr:hypothetical protein [Lachnospiraceae bacterium]
MGVDIPYEKDNYGNVRIKHLEKNIDDFVMESNANEYNPGLAHMLAILSQSAYDDLTKGNNQKRCIELAYENMGFTKKYDGAYEIYNYYDYKHDGKLTDEYINYYGEDVVGFVIGHKKMSNGNTLVLITIRGSYSEGGMELESKDWTSNLNIGAISNLHHKGFNAATNDLLQKLLGYLTTYHLLRDDAALNDGMRFVVTGHSRGAAVGNLTEYKLMVGENFPYYLKPANIYGYNFACPDTIRYAGLFEKYRDTGGLLENENDCDNIFNINNARDPVSVIPGHILPYWGKFGISRWFSKDWSDLSQVRLDLTFGVHTLTAKDSYIDFLSEKYNLNDSHFKNSWDRNQVLSEDILSYITTVFVKCPVDVDILDGNDNILVSVKGNKTIYNDSELSDIMVFVQGEEKYFCLIKDIDYQVKIKGTGIGTMEYLVGKLDLNTGIPIESIQYDNVMIEENKVFFSEVKKERIEKTKLYVVNKANSAIKEVKKNGNEIQISSS